MSIRKTRYSIDVLPNKSFYPTLLFCVISNITDWAQDEIQPPTEYKTLDVQFHFWWLELKLDKNVIALAANQIVLLSI